MSLKRIISFLLALLLLASASALTIGALEPHGTGIKMRKWLTNDPNYQFSEAYKTSVWYQNFTALEMSDNDRNNILRIAVSQLGYHEGDSAEDFDGMNFNGSANYIEYARLLVPHYNDNAYEWCACFVNWCLNQAHYDKASSEIGCWKWVGELKEMNMWQDSAAYKGTYTPKPADFIFFNWNGVNTGSGHIGYVLYTTDTHVFTVEGNADNNVTVRSYELSDPRVIGYGTPPYNEGTEPTIDYSYAEGMPRGQYVVNSMTANLMTYPTSERICRVPVGSSVTLYSVEGDYAKVGYNDKVGYLPKSCLFLLTAVEGMDALTFDANGGQGVPEAQEIPYGESYTLPDTIPTLEGDTFLGWSTVSYNVKVDYQPGDTVTITGNTTLYAVWEKRSLTLAKEAADKGLIPEYPRPNATTNSSALLLGTLKDTSAFTTLKDTELKLVEDEELGKVLSFVSTAKSDDPHVILSYAELCKSLRLAPVTGDRVDFVVMLVKDVSMNDMNDEDVKGLALYFNGDPMTKSVSLIGVEGGWHYITFDVSASGGFEGELETMKIGWQKSSSEAGNTLLVSDIFFVNGTSALNAICDGQYVYPTQELLEIDTEAPTDVPTEPVTQPDPTPDVSEQETSAGTSEGTSDGTSAETSRGTSSGCFGAVLPISFVMISALSVALLKKKEH